MLIYCQGNVGIATENPAARLDVAGDAKFSGSLSVHDDLTVKGAAHLAGDLSVTGKLIAASFAGDGARLSNVTPTDDSVSSTKLAQDAASLSKVSDGKMVVQGDSVAIGGRLEINGAVKFQGSGSTTPGSTNCSLTPATPASTWTPAPASSPPRPSTVSRSAATRPTGRPPASLHLHAFDHGLSGGRALVGRQRPDASTGQLPPIARQLARSRSLAGRAFASPRPISAAQAKIGCLACAPRNPLRLPS